MVVVVVGIVVIGKKGSRDGNGTMLTASQ